jgi:hypothetical protein
MARKIRSAWCLCLLMAIMPFSFCFQYVLRLGSYYYIMYIFIVCSGTSSLARMSNNFLIVTQ